MQTPFRSLHSPRCITGCSLAGVFMGSLALLAPAQQPPPMSAEVQREAMHKLAFLAGRWSGQATIPRGAGEPLHLTQSEDVEYKLDGLVLLIEGKSCSADGKEQFSALATIAYDDGARTYHIRAYNAGRYVDAELDVHSDGFAWSFPAGPARIVNTMHLNDKGEWQEVTNVTVGNTPARPSVEMLLQRLR